MYPENDFIPWGVQVHYCIYPQWAIAFGKLLGFLTVRYNMVPPPLLPRTYALNPGTHPVWSSVRHTYG